ncbi:prolyl oligopeptidase family serine peptidase [Nocardioides humilatus]|uniref:Prolyl oligopeptidase family serine peptidase n=1 Tax=Nocardioides humilatus TaxID=2607660 RepID=A0A5B1L5H1_9ACTN|nr:prolyl oligopeptidase family serine peptidase [Nocardioides humilatus]KAA1415010.1 prolyl oligopeptidase family serine peptidase [Nocardioides humilatus]
MKSSRIGRLLFVGLLVMVGLVPAPPAGSTGSTLASSSAPSSTAAALTWKTYRRVLDDGRAYFVRGPSCSTRAAAGCSDQLAKDRGLVFFLHGAGGAEDGDTARSWLQGLNGFGPDTIFVYALSKDGTLRWDAGFCCTEEPVDDVGYVLDVLDDIGKTWAINPDRIGATGLSNGGMLSLRLACERPDVFPVVAALAATYVGPCDTAKVKIGQWHGAADPRVPLDGGTVTLLGQEREIPSVASLAARMKGGSTFMLRVIPRREHSMTWKDFRHSTTWLLDTMRH